MEFQPALSYFYSNITKDRVERNDLKSRFLLFPLLFFFPFLGGKRKGGKNKVVLLSHAFLLDPKTNPLLLDNNIINHIFFFRVSKYGVHLFHTKYPRHNQFLHTDFTLLNNQFEFITRTHKFNLKKTFFYFFLY